VEIPWTLGFTTLTNVRRMTMNKPHMYYWTEDDLGHQWRILIQGEYESYPDGNNIVADLEAVEYFLMTDEKAYPETNVPDEITGFVESLLDDKDTYLDIQSGYEEEGQHLI
jgi:hypothetical protein